MPSHVDSLAIFTGPQAYISPSWYPSKREHGKVVPTWNYIVVHAYGPLRTIDDAAWVRAFVTRLTEIQERDMADPWRIADAPESFIERMVADDAGDHVDAVLLKMSREVHATCPRTPGSASSRQARTPLTGIK